MQAFRTAAETKDIDALSQLLGEDVVFRSPIEFSPYQGKEAVTGLLTMVSRALEDVRNVRELGDAEGAHHALVFEARVGDRELEGCVFLRTREDGLIDELVVMVRPLSAAHALNDAVSVQRRRSEGGGRPASPLGFRCGNGIELHLGCYGFRYEVGEDRKAARHEP